MQTGAITGYIDVAQIALYVFWIFFAGLIYYLRTEDKREGYPLVTERADHFVQGFPLMPSPKTFILAHGGIVTAPRREEPQPAFNASPTAGWAGAPLQPLGSAMLSRSGPGAYALRADSPDLTETFTIRIVPLRVASDHYVDPECPDPRGMEVLGADGVVGGLVSDIWIDVVEKMVFYLEVTLAAGPSVLVPMRLIQINVATGQAFVQSILGSQFADAPLLANPDQVTLREEDQIQAYFAGGNLFANPGRLEPLL